MVPFFEKCIKLLCMHLMALLFQLSMQLLPQAPVDSGLAARYGYPGDRYAGRQGFACQRVLSKRMGSDAWRKMRKQGIAHRFFPCGTEVHICVKDSTRCTNAYVVDRGPFGALDEAGKWHARKSLHEGEHWRGIVDLLPGFARALGISGLKQVEIWDVPDPKKTMSADSDMVLTNRL